MRGAGVGARGREGDAKPGGCWRVRSRRPPPCLAQASRVLLYQLPLVPPAFLEREISKVVEATKASPGII